MGKTVILVCRVSGIPYGVQTSYRWTCPNGRCNIGSHILKIPLISTSDGGHYTCSVMTNGTESLLSSQVRRGKHVLYIQYVTHMYVRTIASSIPPCYIGSDLIVTSQNRILDHEAVITNIQEIAGDQEIGVIQCRSFNGDNVEWLGNGGPSIPTSPMADRDMYKIENGSMAILSVKLTSHISDDFYCTYADTKDRQSYINLYLSEDSTCK